MPEKTALITGITGQDGSYLLELLQTKGYDVHGLARPNTVRSFADNNSLRLHIADLTDSEAVTRVVQSVKPDECYHLAAQTFVPGQELESVRVNVDGTLILLQAIATHSPHCRVFYAGSSEMFGDVRVCPQDETTPFRPRNVYGVSKVAGFHLMAVYRTKYKLFASCGILYNHESPRRSSQFLARKITLAWHGSVQVIRTSSSSVISILCGTGDMHVITSALCGSRYSRAILTITSLRAGMGDL